MKYIIVLFMVVQISLLGIAQNNLGIGTIKPTTFPYRHDSLEIPSNGFFHRYKQNSIRLGNGDLWHILALDTNTKHPLKVAKTSFYISYSLIAGSLVTLILGPNVVNNNPTWIGSSTKPPLLLFVGDGLFALAIPFIVNYLKNIRKAAEIYNRGVRK